ncbi:MAG: arabinose-5-phosphate isomerase, partial [Neolewinella sp.]
MKNTSLILGVARKTLEIEATTLRELAGTLDETFVDCVMAIYAGTGRVVVTGIGKTALVAKKIVATLNSTGTPSLFFDAAHPKKWVK